MPHSRSSSLVLLALIALLAVAGVLVATQGGAGTSPNSVVYLSAARSLAAGEGLMAVSQQGGIKPLTHYPPLLPWILSMPAGAGIEPLTAGRWVNALAFGGCAWLLGLIILDLSGSRIRAAVGALFFSGAIQSLEIFTFVLSESIFLLLLLASLWFLNRYARAPRWTLLILAAAAIGLAGLSRYAGAAFIAAGTLAVGWIVKRDPGIRWARSLAFALLGGGPLAVWLAHNMMVQDSAVNREIALHAIGIDHANQAIQSLSSWVAPIGLPGAMKLLMAALVAASGVYAWLAGRKAGDPERGQFLDSLVVFMAAYGALLIVSISLVDAATPLNRRLLNPVFAAGLILVLGGAPRSSTLGGGRKPVLAAAWIVTVLLSLFNAARGAEWVRTARREGLGYSSVRWQGSELMAAVREVPESVTLYTNAVEVLYQLAGRVADQVPVKTDKYSRKPVPGFEESMAALAESVSRGEAAVVFVHDMGRSHLAGLEELEAAIAPARKHETPEGVIFR